MRSLIIALASLLSLNSSPAQADAQDAYQLLSAREKQDVLWRNISANPYSNLPSLDGESGATLRAIFFSGIKHSFTSASDEMASNRTKIIHKWGSAVKIRLETDPTSPYSGIFKTGAVGIARMSLALPFAHDGNFVPGLALKFLVDGQPSKNLTVMERFEGQGTNTNYFKSVFTNILPDPEDLTTKFGTWAFEGFVNDAIHLAVDHVASVSASGAASEVVKAPYQLLFVPAEGVALSENASDFRLELAKVPTGTAIYEVFGKESEAKGSPIKRIGRIITESEFAASRYQDETLYFQHAGSELKSGYILRWLHLPY